MTTYSVLLKEVQSDPDYGEETFAVDMGHIAAPINRAWASRDVGRELTDEEWEAFRKFPSDLTPIA